MTKKTSKKGVPQKKLKNEARGRPQTLKIQQKPTRKNQKSQKIAKKKRFLRRPIFDEISTCKKTRKKAKKKRTDACLAGCAVPAGGKEGCTKVLNPPGLCVKTCEEFCNGVYARDFTLPSSTPRKGAADSIAARIPPSPIRTI